MENNLSKKTYFMKNNVLRSLFKTTYFMQNNLFKIAYFKTTYFMKNNLLRREMVIIISLLL